MLKIVERARAEGLEVPVVPMALTHLWGSFFSRIERVDGRPTAMTRPFRRGLFSRVGLNVGEPLAPEALALDALRERVAALSNG